jgi:putative transposase
LGPVDRVVLDVARGNPTDGTRMVAALTAGQLGEPVNRKRVQRLMREHRLLQPKRNEGRRKRPGVLSRSPAPTRCGTWT